MDNYTVKTLSQYHLEYSDQKFLIKFRVDDMREPVPQVIIYDVFNKEENKMDELSKEAQFEILKRYVRILNQEAIKKYIPKNSDILMSNIISLVIKRGA